LEVKSNNIRTDIANIGYAIGFVYRSDRKLSLLKLALVLIQASVPLAMLFILKLLVDEVTSATRASMNGGFSQIWFYSGLFCLIFLIGSLVKIVNQYTEEILQQKLIDFISRLIHDKSIELDLAYYDNPEYHDTFHRAQQEAGYRPVQIVNNINGIIGDSVSLMGILFILTALSKGIVVVLVLAGLPSLWAKIAKYRDLYQWRQKNTALFRKTDYYSMLITHRRFAKEIKIFNIGSYFRNKFNEIRTGLVKAILQIIRKKAVYEMFSAILEASSLIIVIMMLARESLAGAITIGSFVMYFEAFRRGQSYVQGVLINLSGLYNNKLFLGNLFEFLSLKPHIKSPDNPKPFPDKIIRGIRFERVSFAYPGSGKTIIDDLTFEAKPGEISLIQGENGSGKTTIIKLLCRMYDCTQGNIYIEGVNIKDIDLQELRKNISIIFQDFAQFDLTAGENITLGDIERNADFERLEQVAEYSCAKPVIEQLSRKYDTILGKYFQDGEELSMGQWQRIALGRALFNDAPIMIFDEPTSWLDVKAETQFYRTLTNLKKDKILLVISHSTNTEFQLIKTDSVSRVSLDQINLLTD